MIQKKELFIPTKQYLFVKFLSVMPVIMVKTEIKLYLLYYRYFVYRNNANTKRNDLLNRKSRMNFYNIAYVTKVQLKIYNVLVT